MRLILNIIWLVLCGFWMSILWVLAGIVMCLLIITIPLGIQAFKTANYVLWPFGRTIVKRDDAGAGSLLGNVIWILLVGWELAIGHLVTGVLLAITIIGLPLAAANFKLIPISLVPFGRVIVPTSQSSSAGITQP
jgi:uncharacterized membrane protein YccF (DUF307 family)